MISPETSPVHKITYSRTSERELMAKRDIQGDARLVTRERVHYLRTEPNLQFLNLTPKMAHAAIYRLLGEFAPTNQHPLPWRRIVFQAENKQNPTS